MIIDGDDLIFSTGKKIYANNGIIGIGPDGDLYEGYDGDIDAQKLTPFEQRELADFVINQWEQWKKHYGL